jgi:hypothetical protein
MTKTLHIKKHTVCFKYICSMSPQHTNPVNNASTKDKGERKYEHGFNKIL